MSDKLKTIAQLTDALCITLCDYILEDPDFAKPLYRKATEMRADMPSEIRFEGFALYEIAKRVTGPRQG